MPGGARRARMLAGQGGRQEGAREDPVESWPTAGGHATASSVGRAALLLERVLPVAALVVAVVGAPVLIFSPQGLPRLRGLEKELADVDEENAEVRREIEALRGKVALLRDDPGAVERIARDNLGLVRQTEVVFQFQTRR
jgi:cell division protein FtsB